MRSSAWTCRRWDASDRSWSAPISPRPGGTTKRPNGCWTNCARCQAGVQAESQRLLSLARLEIDGRLARGDLAGALDAGRAALVRSRPADPRYLWPLLATVMRACAGGERGQPAARSLRPGPGYARTWSCGPGAPTGPGRCTRPGPRPSPRKRPAPTAVATWPTGMPPPRPGPPWLSPEEEAYALLRAAGAASAAGNREGAAVRLGRSG